MKSLILSVVLCIAAFSASAQKLPKVQTASVYVPADIKIDGKPDEWHNSFQAYNPNDYYFYTISNDDQNLYLILYTTDHICASKILYGGITLDIYKADEKKNAIEVTYPIAVYKAGNMLGGYLRFFSDKAKYPNESPEHLKSIKDTINRKITELYKEISVKGINEIDDPLISVYNDKGIKVSMLYNDKQTALTYELAIPRKYLKSITDNFKYTITLNGRIIPMGPYGNYEGRVSRPTGELDSPTDLTGKYTLAKK